MKQQNMDLLVIFRQDINCFSRNMKYFEGKLEEGPQIQLFLLKHKMYVLLAIRV